VHAVSGLSPEAAVDWATAGLTLNAAAKIAPATRIILISDGRNSLFGWQRPDAAMVPGRPLRHCDRRHPDPA
jgi:hypothetical protein